LAPVQSCSLRISGLLAGKNLPFMDGGDLAAR
jgi:hypothetical protein